MFESSNVRFENDVRPGRKAAPAQAVVGRL